MKGLLAKKVGMTQIFDDQGKAIPVTVVEAGPCVVVQKKTKEKDGYQALQIGFGTLPEKKVNKPMKKHLAKSKKLPKILKEIKLAEDVYKALEVGAELKADIFKKDELVKVSGHSIGKGFAGSIKRWNFSKQNMTHGCKARRLPGSMGATDRGGRIVKGKKMGGRLGNEKITTANLKIIEVEDNIILIKGSVPGPKNGVVFIYNDQKLEFTKPAKKEEKPAAVPQEQAAGETKQAEKPVDKKDNPASAKATADGAIASASKGQEQGKDKPGKASAGKPEKKDKKE